MATPNQAGDGLRIGERAQLQGGGRTITSGLFRHLSRPSRLAAYGGFNRIDTEEW
jgi:hypothetical protein